MSVWEGTKGAVSSALSGLTALDVLSEEQRSAMQKAVGALEIFCGASQMVVIAKALTEVKNVTALAVASAQTSALTITGAGLANIALASAITVGAGVAIYAVLDTVLDGNLNDPVDRARIETQAGLIQ